MSPVSRYHRSLDAQFGTPYPRSVGFDTDIGAFIESSSVASTEGPMAHLVINDNITSEGALIPGQTLRLGNFTVGAHPAIQPKATPQVGENPLCISPEYSNKMDPTHLSSLNELLDRIAALGVSTDYDQIRLKPGQREIKSSLITHQVAVVEEQADNNSSPTLRTNYVRISEPGEPDTHP